MKKTYISILVIALIIAVGVGYAYNKDDKDPIKIGVATILNGDYSVLGQNIVKSARIAVDDINAGGGINGRQIELLVEDSGLDSKTGLSAGQKLINVDGVRYIVGGMSSNGTLAVAPLANEKKAIVMTPVTGGKNIDEAGEYIFRNANSDVLAGRDLAEAMIKMGYTKVGVVAEITEYTIDIKKTFEETIKAKGGEVVVSEEFQSDAKEYRTLVSKVRQQRPQAILVLSQIGTNAAQFIKQSRQLGYNPPIFTDFTFATNDNAKKIAGNFEGIYFADPAYDAESEMSKAFFQHYKSTFGTDPAIPFHSAATYDAIMMYADAIGAAGDNSEKVKDWLLKNVKDRQGVMGKFSFDAQGNSDIGFEVKVIKGGKPISIK